MSSSATFRLLTSLALGLLSAASAMAANPIEMCKSGKPYVWPNGGLNVAFHPDQGGLGPLTNGQAVTMVEEAFAKWAGVPTATVTFVNAGFLPVNVDATNFTPYLFGPPDGLSPIVFDQNNEISQILFGIGAGVVGFGGPTVFDPEACEVREGSVFLTGNIPLELMSFEGFMLHEFGHFSGLGHSATNTQVVGLGDPSGPSPANTFGFPPASGSLETMGGATFVQPSLHLDDIVMISTLYPAPHFAGSTGTITGRVLAPDGVTPLTGVNVIARNIASPFTDAVSAVAGNYAMSLSPTDPFAGVFAIRGLTPGAQYAIYVDEIMTTNYSTPAVALAGPEEFWNGANESNNRGLPDDPAQFTPIASAAGHAIGGIDIIFNAPVPGEPLGIGDEGVIQLPLPFSWTICGERFSIVFVHAMASCRSAIPVVCRLGLRPAR